MIFKKTWEREKRNRIVSRWENWAAIIVLASITLTMYYADITVTAQFSLTFIDSLFDGRFASFYNNALATGIAPEGAVYDVGLYLIFAIWGVPVWFLRKFAGINALGVCSLLWFKMLLVLFLFESVILVKKISLELGFSKKNSEYICWTYALSMLLVFPVLVAAQYDIIPLVFILFGIWKWIQRDKIKYMVSFAVAFTMKPFALFAFIIILLLEEKKILKIVVTGLFSIMPFVVCKGIYLINPTNQASNNSFAGQMFPKLLKSTFQSGQGSVSVFFLIFVLLCMIAYIYKPGNDYKLVGRHFIWIMFILWSSFCLFVDVHPYWVVYLAPFLSIIVFYDRTNTNFMMILDLVINVGTIVLMIIQYSWVYGGQTTFAYLLLKPVYERIDHENISTVAGVLKALNIAQLQPIISATVLGAIICVAFLSWRGMVVYNDDEKEIIIYPWHMRIRILILYAWMAVCCLLLVL